MNRFEQTKIWQKTLAPKLNEDSFSKERELLRVEYEKFRDRAALVAAEIARDLPQFTVHDITHIDALWTLTDLIVPDDYELNPAEVFVLGGAFLIHDLGMGLAAYPNGIDALRQGTLWDDTISFYYKKDFNRCPTIEELKNPSIEIEKKALETILRLLHAKHSESLALLSWKAQDQLNEYYYLIDNKELRDSYGKIIGLVAHSHWWSVEELSKKLNTKLGAPGIFPQEWIVDPIKIALILRVSDAANVDDRRSPGFLRALRKTTGYSDLHWKFQQKLYQPRAEAARLVYTSKASFPIDECDSWWLCFDTLKLLDQELRDADSLLAETKRQRLNVIAVAGVEDPKRMATLITVKDWQPVDTHIKVGDVAQLVVKLGGKELYGEDYSVPLKELIQNGADAIRARRVIEDENLCWGDIVIRTGKDENGIFLEIEDNGVGMSPRVLTGPFLDFGQSFWGSQLMHEELPGLESKKFTSTGKYGIGFYSIFMITNKVSIFSRRYDEARENTWCLEFSNGVKGRPILRKANNHETSKNGGTRIRFFITQDILDKILLTRRHRTSWTLEDIISRICIALDVNVTFQANNEPPIEIIKANDWVTIPSVELVTRIVGKTNFKNAKLRIQEQIQHIANNIDIIKSEEGSIIGRCCIYADHMYYDDVYLDINGIIVVGGLKTDKINNFIGVIIGRNLRAARDRAMPLITKEVLQKWTSHQASKLSQSDKISEEIKQELASIIWKLNGSTENLPIGRYKRSWITYSELISILKENKSEIIIVSNYTIQMLEDNLQTKIEVVDNAFEIDHTMYHVFRLEDEETAEKWPPPKEFPWEDSLCGYFLKAISQAWDIDPEKVYKYYLEKDESRDNVKIGTMDGKDVCDDAIILNFDKMQNFKIK